MESNTTRPLNSNLSVKSKALITTKDRVCFGAPYSCAVVRGQGGFVTFASGLHGIEAAASSVGGTGQD